MADRPPPGPRWRSGASPSSPAEQRQQQHSLLGHAVQWFAFHAHGGSATQLLGFLALAVALTALLVLAGVTLTAAVVLLGPLALLTAPLWAPVAFVALLLAGAASLLACCATWAHRWWYFTRRHHVVRAHRDRVEHADADEQYSRGGGGGATVADVANAYAREYGGYPPRPHAPRVKDAAPGA